jgi:HEAT repeat protein
VTLSGQPVPLVFEYMPAPNPEIEEILRVLVDDLHDPDASVRADAARVIQEIGVAGNASITAPALVQALSDPAPPVRAAVAQALSLIGYLGPHEAPAVRGLRTLLNDRDMRVREAAAQALRILGY